MSALADQRIKLVTEGRYSEMTIGYINELVASGLSMPEIAKYFNQPVTKVYRLARLHPSYSEARKLAQVSRQKLHDTAAFVYQRSQGIR